MESSDLVGNKSTISWFMLGKKLRYSSGKFSSIIYCHLSS